MTLFVSVAEALSNVVAFALAMHNANVHLSMADFTAAFQTPKQKP